MRTGRTLLAAMATSLVAAVTAVAPAASAQAVSKVYGQDVSSWQGNVDWAAQYRAGARFAFVKATEGTYYRNPYFTQQYEGSYYAGMMHAAYHFARPDRDSGATQADFFVAHGGGWSKDAKTLPGMIDLEYNPYGSICYGLSQSAMRSWIASFINHYEALTGRWAVIYTTTDWWSRCTGDYSGFWANDPLFVARYAGDPGTLPTGTPFWSFWQYSNTGPLAGDSDQWNGSLTRLRVLACNGPC